MAADAERYQSLAVGDSVVRFIPGTPGEAAAPVVARSLAAVMPRLAALAGGELAPVAVELVDPFADPAQPRRLITHGSVLYPQSREVRVVVTDESPAEPIGRPLALLAGARLPLAPVLPILLEGYGLHASGAADPDPVLRGLDLPPLTAAEGDLGAAMGLSLVRHLAAAHGDEAVVEFLCSATPETIEQAASQAFGEGAAAIEMGWRAQLTHRPPAITARGFLALAYQQLAPYRRQQFEMFVYMLGGLVFGVAFPFAFRALVDTAIPTKNGRQVAVLLAVLGGAFLVTLLSEIRRFYLSGYVSSAVVRDLRSIVFERLQALELGWFRSRQAGDVIARVINDVDTVERGLSQALREGAFEAIRLVVSMAVLVVLNPLLSAIVVLGIPAVAIVYRQMAEGAQRRSLAVQESLGALTAVANENYDAQAVVKVFGLEQREQRRFDAAGERTFQTSVRLQLYSGVFAVTVDLIVTVLRIAVLAVGAVLVFHGSLTIGGLVAFVLVMGQALAPVTVLTLIGQQLQASTGALTRLREVLDAAPVVAERDGAVAIGPLQEAIELRGVDFSHDGLHTVLRGVDVRIPRASKVAFVGPSGAGKSSVVGLLTRLYDPSAGVVLFDGRDIREATLASVRDQIGMVFQDSFLFDGSLRENIAVGRPGASAEQVEEAARSAGLEEALSALVNGYDTPVGEGGARLSGGQRQRVAIARALLRDPPILVLDEATSALDPRTERQVTEAFERAAAGRTTVAVTHRLASVAHYDAIHVVSEGRIVGSGDHQTLLRDCAVYAELWAEQSRPAATQQVGVTAALRRAALFAPLADDQLAVVAASMTELEREPGATFAESDGMLLVTRGAGTVLQPGLRGESLPIARLGPGDIFGLGALMGDPGGYTLRADERVAGLLLTSEALDAIRAAVPELTPAPAAQAPDAAHPAEEAVRVASSSGLFLVPGELLAAEVALQAESHRSESAIALPTLTR